MILLHMEQAQDSCCILDGGFATELVKDGFAIDGDPLWSARLLRTNPEAIKRVHSRFLKAGSDIIITATYQASITGFKNHLGCTYDEAESLIVSGGKLANEARDEFWENYKSTIHEESISSATERCYPRVFGSVGPYGACLSDGSEYTGKYVDSMSSEELMDWHRPRISALVKAGVEYLAVETIPAKKEAEAIAVLLREFPATKAWITFSCKNGTDICHGEQFLEAVQAVSKFEQVIGIGLNCTSPQFVEPLLKSIQGKTSKTIIVYPNSGETWNDGSWVTNKSMKKLHEFVPSWLMAGANWIGGCCRTTPDDIARIKEVVTQTVFHKR